MSAMQETLAIAVSLSAYQIVASGVFAPEYAAMISVVITTEPVSHKMRIDGFWAEARSNRERTSQLIVPKALTIIRNPNKRRIVDRVSIGGGYRKTASASVSCNNSQCWVCAARESLHASCTQPKQPFKICKSSKQSSRISDLLAVAHADVVLIRSCGKRREGLSRPALCAVPVGESCSPVAASYSGQIGRGVLAEP